MSWLWLNLPFAAVAFGAVFGLPLWLVIKHPDAPPVAAGATGTVPQTAKARLIAAAASNPPVYPAYAPARTASAERDAA